MGLKDVFKDVKGIKLGINSLMRIRMKMKNLKKFEEIKKAPKKSLFSKKTHEEEILEEDDIEDDNNFSTVFIDQNNLKIVKKLPNI